MGGGSYLYLKYPPNVGHLFGDNDRTGDIITMPTKLSYDEECMMFYAQINGTATLTVSIIQYGYGVNLKEVILSPVGSGQTKQTVTGPVTGWQPFSYNIGTKLMPSASAFSVKISGKVQRGQMIVLDDVEFISGRCPGTVTDIFFCKGSQKQYNTSQRCDFYKDCPQGDDELNCGDCDFEKGEYHYLCDRHGQG